MLVIMVVREIGSAINSCMKTFIEFLKEGFDCNLPIVEHHWKAINKASFDGKLKHPKISVLSQEDMNKLGKSSDGDILGYCDAKDLDNIKLYFSKDITDIIELAKIVAHEMVHQALAQELGYHEMRIAEHGSKFMAYAPQIKKYRGTLLVGKSID
jgi:hypothetical protein